MSDEQRRTVTPAQVEDQRRGSTRIAPGIWQDRHGGIHFSVPELLALVELSDTPEHREAVVRMVREQFEAAGGAPNALIIQDPES